MAKKIYEDNIPANKFFLSTKQPVTYYDSEKDTFVIAHEPNEKDIWEAIEQLRLYKADVTALQELNDIFVKSLDLCESKTDAEYKYNYLLKKIEGITPADIDKKLAELKAELLIDIQKSEYKLEGEIQKIEDELNDKVDLDILNDFKLEIARVYETQVNASQNYNDLSERIDAIDVEGVINTLKKYINDEDNKLKTMISANTLEISKKADESELKALEIKIAILGDLSHLLAQINDNTLNIEKNKFSIHKNADDIVKIYDILKEVGDITKLVEEIHKNTEDISLLKTSVDNIKVNVADLNTKVTTNIEDITQLKTDTTQLKTDTTKLRTNVDNNTEDISENKKDIEQLKTDVHQNSANININSVNISNLNTKVTKNVEDIVILKTDTTQLKTDTTQLKTDVSQLKTDTSVLKTETTQLRTDVDKNKEDISKISTEDVPKIKEDIVQLKTDVHQNSANISNNSTSINTLFKNVITLDTEVKEHENRLLTAEATQEQHTSLLVEHSEKIGKNSSDIEILEKKIGSGEGLENKADKSALDAGIKTLSEMSAHKVDSRYVDKELAKRPYKSYVDKTKANIIHEHDQYLEKKFYNYDQEKIEKQFEEKLDKGKNKQLPGKILSVDLDKKPLWIDNPALEMDIERQISYYLNLLNGDDAKDGKSRENAFLTPTKLRSVLKNKIASPRTKVNIYLVLNEDVDDYTYYNDGKFEEFLYSLKSMGNSFITIIGDTKLLYSNLTLASGTNTDEYTNNTLGEIKENQLQGCFFNETRTDATGTHPTNEFHPIVYNNGNLLKSVKGVPLTGINIIKNKLIFKSFHYLNTNFETISFVNITFESPEKIDHMDLHMNATYSNFSNCYFNNMCPNLFNASDIKEQYTVKDKEIPGFVKYYDKLGNEAFSMYLDSCLIKTRQSFEPGGHIRYNNSAVCGISSTSGDVTTYPDFISITKTTSANLNVEFYNSNTFMNLNSIFGGRYLKNLKTYGAYLTFTNIDSIITTNIVNIDNMNGTILDLDVNTTVGNFYKNETNLTSETQNNLIMNGHSIKIKNYFKNKFMSIPLKNENIHQSLNGENFKLNFDDLLLNDVEIFKTVSGTTAVSILNDYILYSDNINKIIKFELVSTNSNTNVVHTNYLVSIGDAEGYTIIKDGDLNPYTNFVATCRYDPIDGNSLNYSKVNLTLSAAEGDTFNICGKINTIKDYSYIATYYKVKQNL